MEDRRPKFDGETCLLIAEQAYSPACLDSWSVTVCLMGEGNCNQTREKSSADAVMEQSTPNGLLVEVKAQSSSLDHKLKPTVTWTP